MAWTGQDDTAIRDYDVQVSIQGGPWHDWLIKTTQTSHPYFGASGYGFAFRVRARDLQGNASPWDVSSVYRPQPTLAVGAFGTVVASTLNVRTSPDTGAAVVTTVDAGTLLAITDGPVSADGYTWYEVTVPITEWSPVGGVQRDVWVAASDASTSLVSAAPAPNTTRVQLPPGVAKPPGARFMGLAPTRVVDTRAGVGLPGPLDERRGADAHARGSWRRRGQRDRRDRDDRGRRPDERRLSQHRTVRRDRRHARRS